MRGIVTALIVVGFVALGAGSAMAQAQPRFAVRGEGYLGYSNFQLELFGQEAEEHAFTGGGTGSAAIAFGPIYLQADLTGDVSDYDPPKSETIGGGGRLGLRDAERGAAGIVGNYSDQEIDDSNGFEFWRVGFEGEAFLDRWTVGLNAGYAELGAGGGDDGSGYIDGTVSFYPMDRLRLHLMGGGYAIEDDDPLGIVGAGAEYLLVDPVSLFTRWEAGIIDESGGDLQQHALHFGVRVYFGAEEPSLVAYDRSHLKTACTGYQLVFTRFC